MAKSYKLIVLTNAAPDNHDEFNEWYDKIHLQDVLKIPGFVAATRFRMVISLTADTAYRYCAIYDLETDDPLGSMAEMQARAGTAEMPISETMHSGFYATLFVESSSLTQRSDAAEKRACKH